jgi:ribosomal protein L21E
MKKRYKDMSKKHEEMESKAEEAKEYEMEEKGYKETEKGKMVKPKKAFMGLAVEAAKNPVSLLGLAAKNKMGLIGGANELKDKYFAKGGITKSQKKISKVMTEFKKGELHSGKSGKVVKNPKQAIAIALSEAGKSKKMMKASEGMLAEAAAPAPALSEATDPMKTYKKAIQEAASSDRLTESDIKKVSIVEKAKNVYKKLNSPEMRKMMGTGGVKKMYGGGSVLAKTKLGKTRPTKLF